MKLRMPNTYAGAATRAAGLTSVEECAEAIGKSASLFRKAMDPDHDYDLTLPQAEAVDTMLVKAGFVPVFSAVLTARVGCPASPETLPDVMDRLSAVFQEAGELSGEVRAAVCPTGPGGRELVKSECAAISARAEDLREELASLIRDMDARMARMGGADVTTLKRAAGA